MPRLKTSFLLLSECDMSSLPEADAKGPMPIPEAKVQLEDEQLWAMSN